MAEWDEWTDIPGTDLLHPDLPRTIHRKDHVCDIKVDDPFTESINITQFETKEGYTHEIGDTRHRYINYYLIGTTRFREFFPPSITKDVENISCTGPNFLPAISISSSARPHAPKVLYVIPGFEWRKSTPIYSKTGLPGHMIIHKGSGVYHERLGQTLRVYLDRPWFSSGDGEELGVVLLRENDTDSPPDSLKSYISQCGMDPLWIADTPVTTLSTIHFPYASHIDDQNSTLDEIVIDQKTGLHQPVSVAAHQVQYDPERNLWFCDIRVETNTDKKSSYFPFIRLALARYQHDSVSGTHLSRVVLSEFAQLAPDRGASVTYDPTDNEGTNLEVSVSGKYPKFDCVFGKYYIKCGGNFIEVTARIEVADQTIPEERRDPCLSWFPVKGEFSLEPHIEESSSITWRSPVKLPGPRTSKPYRLVIEEFELIPQDQIPRHGGKPFIPIGRRLIYADIFELKNI
jgi:hypothetical protein